MILRPKPAVGGAAVAVATDRETPVLITPYYVRGENDTFIQSRTS